MAASSHWGMTPRESIEAECARRGRQALVDGCASLLLGEDEDVEESLVTALGGPGAGRALRNPDQQYWLRVWGARGLLWVWEDTALPAVLAAFGDDAWRVREMAAKAVGRNLVGDALEALSALFDDPVPRVRAAAMRAAARITAAGV